MSGAHCSYVSVQLQVLYLTETHRGGGSSFGWHTYRHTDYLRYAEGRTFAVVKLYTTRGVLWPSWLWPFTVFPLFGGRNRYVRRWGTATGRTRGVGRINVRLSWSLCVSPFTPTSPGSTEGPVSEVLLNWTYYSRVFVILYVIRTVILQGYTTPETCLTWPRKEGRSR